MKKITTAHWFVFALIAGLAYMAWKEQRKPPAPGSADFIGPVLPNS